MSEINVPAESLPQMPAADALSTTDLMYILQGSGLDRDRSITISALLADPLVVAAINTNEQWRTFNVTPAPSKIQSFSGWVKNVILNLNTPPYDTLTVSSALTSAVMLVFPQYASGIATSVTFTLSLLNGTGTTYKTVVIPNRHFAVIRYGSDSTIVGVSFVANDDASPANKTMVSGTTFADDGYRKTQEIIVTPELTPDDGLLMTTAVIQCYSITSVLKIVPDWKHVAAQNSLVARVLSLATTLDVTIPYGCIAEVTYKTDKGIANVAVIPSMDYLIQTSNIKDGAVTTAKINTAAVTDVKLAASSVTEGKIGTGAVTETKLGTGSVTEAKIASCSVTSSKIALDVNQFDATTSIDLDAIYPGASYFPGYLLILSPSDTSQTTYHFLFNNTSQSVVGYAYTAMAFVLVDAGVTYGRQWRPVGNFNP